MNTSLIDTLAQVILSLSKEEQSLLQQQLAPQPKSTNKRRQISRMETGDSFDFCVAETTAEPLHTQHYCKNFPIHSYRKIESDSQSKICKTHLTEKRSQKGLSMFREVVPPPY
ncbi:MAG: hypothetical protein WBA13_16345 [Microcoleaceae cyanobacterium]